MAKPIIDKAEVSIDFPDKYYYGTFSKASSFDVTADAAGLHIFLDRQGEDPRHVGFHLQYYLLAGVLESAANSISKMSEFPQGPRQGLLDSAKNLVNAIVATEENK